MRILHVNALFHPYIGGIERYIYELGRRQVKRHDVHVFTSKLPGTRSEEVIDGIKVHRTFALVLKRLPRPLPPPYVLAPLAPFAMKPLVRACDVVHLHSRFFLDFNWAVLIAKKEKKPVVFSIHDAKPEKVDVITDNGARVFDFLIGDRIMRKCDALIANSEYTARKTVPEGFKGKVFIIPNGVDVRKFRPDLAKEREDFTVLYVGRLINQKGVDTLIRAMKDVNGELWIIGRGPKRKKLENLAKKLGIGEKVKFLGFVPDDVLPEYMCKCHVLVLPSRWEPFGMVLLEAMACGRPVIGSRVGGIPEIIKDGENGFLFEPLDHRELAMKLELLREDEGLRKKLGANARRSVEEGYSWEIVVERVEKVYESLV